MTDFVLVSCSKSKLDGVQRAADLYGPSSIFQKRRRFAHQRADHRDAWGVLSARYGYLRPWQAVPTYDQHIGDRTPVWGAFVLDDLLQDLAFHDVDQVTVLAGSGYVDPVVAELEARGFDVIDYNRGKRPGEREAALADALAPGTQVTLGDVAADEGGA